MAKTQIPNSKLQNPMLNEQIDPDNGYLKGIVHFRGIIQKNASFSRQLFQELQGVQDVRSKLVYLLIQTLPQKRETRFSETGMAISDFVGLDNFLTDGTIGRMFIASGLP